MEEKMKKPGVDEIVEHFNVSGVLHVTVDNGSVHTLMFNQHVKVHIAFNKEKPSKELNPLPFVKFESPDKAELIESGEEDDIGGDEEMLELESDENRSKVKNNDALVKIRSGDSISVRKADMKEEIILDKAQPYQYHESKAVVHDSELDCGNSHSNSISTSTLSNSNIDSRFERSTIAGKSSDEFLQSVSTVTAKPSISLLVDELLVEMCPTKLKPTEKRNSVVSDVKLGCEGTSNMNKTSLGRRRTIYSEKLLSSGATLAISCLRKLHRKRSIIEMSEPSTASERRMLKVKDKVLVLEKSPQFTAKITKKQSPSPTPIADSKPIACLLESISNSRQQPKPQETFFCIYCSQNFKTHSELIAHNQVMEKEKFSCVRCSRSFDKKAYLITHEMFCFFGENKSFKFKDSTSTTATSQTTSIDSSEVCDSNSSYNLLKTGAMKFECKECGKCMSDLSQLTRHNLSHTGEYLYKCCVCKFQIRSVFFRFKVHMQKHLTNAGTFECKNCHIFFPTRGELNSHQLSHSFKCDMCDDTFPTKTGRNFHYQTAHKHDILKCPTCGKMFSSEKSLAVHMKYHRQYQRSQCPVCGCLFVRLKKHMESVHPDNVSIFICDKCPKTFLTKLSLSRHVNVHHLDKSKDDQVLYPCHVCDRKYPTCGGLRKHMLTHREEKPYVCNICGKACKQAGNLKTHMNVHNKSEYD